METEKEFDPKCLRSKFRLGHPKKQLMLIVPTMALVGLLIILVYFFIHHVQSSAVSTLTAQGVEVQVSKQLVQKTDPYYIILWVVTGVVGLGALVWVWWLSFWVFGPMARVERELNEVLYGRANPENLRVRKKDALYPIIELVRKTLTKPKE